MWRTLDHTADAALEVEAASWNELLAEAARAFGEWVSGGEAAGRHETERRLDVTGADRIETWVLWWRGLHRLWTVEGFLPLHAHVDAASAELHARGTVGCISAGALHPDRCVDVKAVTWHAARVDERDGRWVGTIVMDL